MISEDPYQDTAETVHVELPQGEQIEGPVCGTLIGCIPQNEGITLSLQGNTADRL